jgi:hypothetical protein
MDDRRGGLDDDAKAVTGTIYEPTEAQERGLRQKGKPDRRRTPSARLVEREQW